MAIGVVALGSTLDDEKNELTQKKPPVIGQLFKRLGGESSPVCYAKELAITPKQLRARHGGRLYGATSPLCSTVIPLEPNLTGQCRPDGGDLVLEVGGLLVKVPR